MEPPQFNPHMQASPAISISNFVKDYIDIALRRKWLILCITIVCVAAASVFAWFKKDVYRSETVILVEQQSIPEKYVSPVVGGNVAERVSTISQQVLSRTNLQKVIKEFNLYPEAIQEGGLDGVLAGMRKNVKVQTKGSGERVKAFTISFAHADPVIAMKVTSKLASQFIDENLRIREQFVEGAADFLEQELNRAKKALDEKERILTEFKLKYMGELPGQLESNLRALDRLQKEKAANQESLNNLRFRLSSLQETIHQYEGMREFDFTAAELEGQPISSQNPGLSLDPLNMKLQELKDRLAVLSLEYTDVYPDVVMLKNQIAILEKELAQKKKSVPAVVEEEKDTPQIASKPQYDPYLQELYTIRDETKNQIAALQKRDKAIAKEMEKYQNFIDATPVRQQELLKLERDYANMQNNYQALHEKRLSSRISENLERRQKAERFRILDPANLPTKPEGLPRMAMVLGGLVVGLGLGYGVAFGLEYWNPTFRRSEEAEVSLGFPVLGSISNFLSAYGKSPQGLFAPEGQAANGTHGNAQDKSLAPLHASDAVANARWWSMANAKSDVPPSHSLVSKWRPHSVVAEEFRVIATKLVQLNKDDNVTVVLATSAIQGEGKTSSVSNLGYTLARDLNKQTLLIGCDFKSPRLHESLGVVAAPGLADVLEERCALDSCMYRLPDIPLWVLPAGGMGGNISLSRFSQLPSLLQTLRPRFDYILLDAPPILPLADMNVLAGLADYLILVVRAGLTPQDLVMKSVAVLRPTIPVGILFTDAHYQSFSPYFVGYHHGYGSSPYIGEKV